MDIQSIFDNALKLIGILIGILFAGIWGNRPLLGTDASTGLSHSSLAPLPLTSNCIAGDFEVSTMWFTVILSLCFLLNATIFTLYGKTYFGRVTNLSADALPTKPLYIMIVCTYTFIMLAVMTTCATSFFLLEVRFMKFHCQPRIFQYTLPSMAITVIVGCIVIIYDVWKIPYM